MKLRKHTTPWGFSYQLTVVDYKDELLGIAVAVGNVEHPEHRQHAAATLWDARRKLREAAEGQLKSMNIQAALTIAANGRCVALMFADYRRARQAFNSLPGANELLFIKGSMTIRHRSGGLVRFVYPETPVQGLTFSAVFVDESASIAPEVVDRLRSHIKNNS